MLGLKLYDDISMGRGGQTSKVSITGVRPLQ
jgi:hypothetical protein